MHTPLARVSTVGQPPEQHIASAIAHAHVWVVLKSAYMQSHIQQLSKCSSSVNVNPLCCALPPVVGPDLLRTCCCLLQACIGHLVLMAL